MGEVSVVVGEGCFGATATAARVATGTTTAFGPAPLQLEPGAKLTLGVAAKGMGATATFAAQGSPAFGTIAGYTYTAPTTQGYGTLEATLTAGGQLLCTVSQPLVVVLPTPLRTSWPPDYLSVAGATLAGGSPTRAVRMNTDGTAFQQVSAEPAQVGGVAALTSGAFWTQAEGDATGLRGGTSRTLYDTAAGLPGAAASEGNSVFYFASDPLLGSTLRKVTPPETGGATLVKLPPSDRVNALVAKNGFAYWAATRTNETGALESSVLRAPGDLAGPPSLVVSTSQLAAPRPTTIASIAVDVTIAYFLAASPNTPSLSSIFTGNPNGSGTKQRFVTAPGAITLAADANHVYWLTADAQLWRRAKYSTTASEPLLAVPGAKGVALALDATSAYFTTSKGLYRWAK